MLRHKVINKNFFLLISEFKEFLCCHQNYFYRIAVSYCSVVAKMFHFYEAFHKDEACIRN